MTERRLIYKLDTPAKAVEIIEKPDPRGNRIVVKTTEFISSETRSDIHALVGLLEFLCTLTHTNLCKIESHRQTAGAKGPVVEVFMEPARIDAQRYIAEHEYTELRLEEDLVPQLDGLIDVLEHAQKQGRCHSRISLDHLLLTEDYVLKLIGFAPITRGREVATSQALDLMYLSPLRASMCQQGRVPPGYNEYKADVYSLGVCMIMLAYTGKEDHMAALRSRNITDLMMYLQEYKGLYARLTKMMAFEENQRPDFVELKAFCKQLAAPPPAPAQVPAKPSLPFATRLCPTCQAPLAGTTCPKCTPSAPKRTAFFTPAPKDGPDILPDDTLICLNCRQRFMQKYSADHRSFEDQFKQFCSESCVMEHAIKKSQEGQ